MKFAKELEEELVPEWRVKYFQYKVGKKKVKAVSKAFRGAPATPSTNTAEAGSQSNNNNNGDNGTPYSAVTRSRRWSQSQSRSQPNSQQPRAAGPNETTSLRGTPARTELSSPGLNIPPKRNNEERDGLTSLAHDMHYGSFGLTPPLSNSPGNALERAQTLELPGPAIGEPPAYDSSVSRSEGASQPPRRHGLVRSISDAVLPSASDFLSPEQARREGNVIHPATAGPSVAPSPRHRLQRMFSNALPSRSPRTPEIHMADVALDVLRQKERDFFDFMASELDKVESFYKLKEDEAGERLLKLKDQLREMRIRRTFEVNEERWIRNHHQGRNGNVSDKSEENGGPDPGYLDQVKARIFRPGPNSRAISRMVQTPVMTAQVDSQNPRRDYVRRPDITHGPPYKTAKRKLKLALQEFYRGLDLLKSYALLNRTAFRKLNKKYDKAVNARPAYRLRFMNEKVNKAWFVNSNVLDDHMKTVEDLYAAYFERDNHKTAVNKLKSLVKKRRDESSSAFRSGVLIGTGLVFAVQGVVFASQLLLHEDITVRQETSYLLQLYGGYFLMLFLFGLFVVNCYVWTDNKINYPFIFEFDQRHHLDWRRLAEFPSFFLLLFGIFIWLNFSRYGSPSLYLYYPVLLIGLTVVILLFPARVLAPTSRKWFAYAHWRLLLAGLYPVEFRDFFLGDIYCSLTYAVCNISLFFCLYSHDWDDPPQCNSSHSRVMGFLAALPPIWRFLQCLRRYYDTRNVFPHLVNGGKYIMSIMTAVTLSIYRISGTNGNLALFIVFATINGFYTSVWDLFMDFSILQTSSSNPFLRDILGLKKRWIYYVIMVVDPILRFSWIFYAIFTHNRQHSTIVSFMVAFAEAFRRGIWALLRVENEHCSNVAMYKASRDVPLPYHLEPLVERPSEEESETTPSGDDIVRRDHAQAEATGLQRVGTHRLRDEEAVTGGDAGTPASAEAAATGTVRRRRTIEPLKPEVRSFSRIMAEAHRQDFVKRRKPGEGDEEAVASAEDRRVNSDDEDEEMDEEDDFMEEDEESSVEGRPIPTSSAGRDQPGASRA